MDSRTLGKVDDMSTTRLVLTGLLVAGAVSVTAPGSTPGRAPPGPSVGASPSSSSVGAGATGGEGPGRDARSAVGFGSRVGAASGAADPPRAGAARWRWPVPPSTRPARPFVGPASPWGAGHRGVDLVAGPAATVLAVEDGVVTHAAVLAGRGTVTVTHADGLRSTYEPLDVAVTVGQVVRAGDRLGSLSGEVTTHCGGRVCLHLGAVRDSGYLDPWPLLVGGRVRLFPVSGR